MDGRHRRWFGDGLNAGETLLSPVWRRRMAGLGMTKDRLIRYYSAFVHLDISKTKGQTCE